jgi:hypothetical protein
MPDPAGSGETPTQVFFEGNILKLLQLVHSLDGACAAGMASRFFGHETGDMSGSGELEPDVEGGFGSWVMGNSWVRD